MNAKTSIQLKAAFLLVVFAMNTIVGFACSLGLDLGFNATHHHEEPAVSVHVHANGHKHEHPAKPHSHLHSSATKAPAHIHAHQPNQEGNAQNLHNPSQEKDGCCNEKVTQLAQSDKVVSQSLKIISPVYFTAFAFVFLNEAVLFPSLIRIDNKYFVRSHHPPPPDILIEIHRFQI